MGAMELVEKGQLTERPRMKAGDTVRVHVRVKEGDKERIQIFEGMIINLRRGGVRGSFTVRKVSFGQGVERIFPMHSPIIQKVDVVRSAKVRRAKLYFLRELKGKAARMKEVKKCQVRNGPRHDGRGRTRAPGLSTLARRDATRRLEVRSEEGRRATHDRERATALRVRVHRRRRRSRARVPGGAGDGGSGRARSRRGTSRGWRIRRR